MKFSEIKAALTKSWIVAVMLRIFSSIMHFVIITQSKTLGVKTYSLKSECQPQLSTRHPHELSRSLPMIVTDV